MLFFIYFFIFFQKRGIEGYVVSTESIGVVAVSLWEPMRLHLSWPRRDRDCGCGMLRSSQLRGDPVPNRSSACDFLNFLRLKGLDLAKLPQNRIGGLNLAIRTVHHMHACVNY